MGNQSAVDGAMKILKENGKKQTKRREIMIDYLARSNRYVSPKEIHLNLTKEYPGLSQDTIYRNLREFAEFGILEETEFEKEKFGTKKLYNFEGNIEFKDVYFSYENDIPILKNLNLIKINIRV